MNEEEENNSLLESFRKLSGQLQAAKDFLELEKEKLTQQQRDNDDVTFVHDYEEYGEYEYSEQEGANYAEYSNNMESNNADVAPETIITYQKSFEILNVTNAVLQQLSLCEDISRRVEVFGTKKTSVECGIQNLLNRIIKINSRVVSHLEK